MAGIGPEVLSGSAGDGLSGGPGRQLSQGGRGPLSAQSDPPVVPEPSHGLSAGRKPGAYRDATPRADAHVHGRGLSCGPGGIDVPDQRGRWVSSSADHRGRATQASRQSQAATGPVASKGPRTAAPAAAAEGRRSTLEGSQAGDVLRSARSPSTHGGNDGRLSRCRSSDASSGRPVASGSGRPQVLGQRRGRMDSPAVPATTADARREDPGLLPLPRSCDRLRQGLVRRRDGCGDRVAKSLLHAR